MGIGDLEIVSIKLNARPIEGRQAIEIAVSKISTIAMDSEQLAFVILFVLCGFKIFLIVLLQWSAICGSTHHK